MFATERTDPMTSMLQQLQTDAAAITPLSPAHVQALLDQAVVELEQTTKSGATMVSRYGADPTKWPAGHWVNGLNLLAAARTEAGHLEAPPPLFTVAISGVPRVGETLRAVAA